MRTHKWREYVAFFKTLGIMGRSLYCKGALCTKHQQESLSTVTGTVATAKSLYVIVNIP